MTFKAPRAMCKEHFNEKLAFENPKQAALRSPNIVKGQDYRKH